MASRSIFADEWRDCLCAHYTYVVRAGDQLTERSLYGVMLEAGFSEGEVKELYVRATAHVDDVGTDFVPDAAVLEAGTFRAPAVVAPEPPEPIEDVIADEMINEEIPVAVVKDLVDEDDAQALEAAQVTDELDAEDDEDDAPPDDPAAMQLSLF